MYRTTYSSDAINDANDDGDDGNFTEKVMLMPPPAATTVAGFPSTQVAPLSADTSKSLMFPLQQHDLATVEDRCCILGSSIVSIKFAY